MQEETGTSGSRSRGLPLRLGNILTVWRKVLVTMATWEFIWRESRNWRLSHCKRLTVEIKKKKKGPSSRNEITFISAGNTKRHTLEKVLYMGQAFHGGGGCVLVDLNAAAS